MPGHDFKSIAVVLNSKALVDYVLSKLQRKTPSVIHKRANIGTQRKFYIRKVKTIGQYVHDYLDRVIKEYPRLNDLHPFYGKLMGTMYGEMEYRQALSHLNKIKTKIDKIAKEHVKLIKYGDSQFRIKTLKRAALGKMVKWLKNKNTKSGLEYLEDVRQSLARLPCIDTTGRTVIMCGYPNVGKSSFLNKVSRADASVESYAFTTKSLIVGHSDYHNLRWQFIDTPGLLDRPVEECTTAENLAITALSKLTDAGVLFLIDLSEQCGYTLTAQIELLRTVKKAFGANNLVIALNKSDVMTIDQLSEENKQLICGLSTIDEDADILSMSTMTDDGVIDVRNAICDKVLKTRVNQKLAKVDTDKAQSRFNICNKVDKSMEENFIPEDVRERLRQLAILKENKEFVKPKSLFDVQKEQGKKFCYDVRHEWDIKNKDEKFTVIPEIYNGHNISDFGYIDMDKLEEWKIKLQADKDAGLFDLPYTPLPAVQRSLAKQIREAEAMKRLENRERMNRGVGRKGRNIVVEEIVDEMEDMGVTMPEDAPGLGGARQRSRSKSEKRKKVEMSELRKESIRRTDVSRARSRSGIRDETTAKKVEKMRKKSHKTMNYGTIAKQGEGDRQVDCKMPKHLFSGQRKNGTNDRR